MAVREKSAFSSGRLISSFVSQGRKKHAAILAAIAATGLLSASHAKADSLWTNTTVGGADFNVPTNWSGGVVPTAGPSATQNADVNNGGTVLIQAGDPTWVPYDMHAGQAGGSNGNAGTYIQTGDTVAANSWFRLGIDGGTTGTYNMNGGVFASHGRIRVGESGTGVLNITGGAFSSDQSQNGSEIAVAASAGSTGTINMSGGTFDDNVSGDVAVQLSENTTSHATFNLSGGTFNTHNSEFWVGQGGTGVVNQTGGTLDVGNWLVLGRGGGNGVYNMSAGALNVTGGGNFEIGEDATDVFNLSGTGVVTSTEQIWIAQNGGTNGTWNMTGGTLNLHNWLAVSRNGGVGTLNLSAGTITQDTNGNVTTGGTGLINQTGGTLNATNYVWLGENGTSGTWNMSGGSSTVNTGINVGQGVTGTLNLSGTATLSSPQIIVGNGGTGTLNVSGGTLTATDITVTASKTVTGTVNLTGGTVITNDFVGGAGTASLTFKGGTIQPAITGTDLIHGFTGTQVSLGTGTTANTINVPATFSTNLSAPLTGTGGFTKTGAGTLALGGSSSYTGVSVVKTGTLQVGVTTYNNNIQDSHVAAYYPFNAASQFTDVSGNNDNLSDANGAGASISTNDPHGATGPNAGSLSLPNNQSNTDYLTTVAGTSANETATGKTPLNFPIGNSSYTFAAWINLDGLNSAANAGNTIIGYGTFGQSRQTNFFRTGDDGTGAQNALNNSWFNADANGNDPAGSNVVGNWNYVAVTYNAVTDVRTMYFDGTVIETDTPGANGATNNSFAVGSDPSALYLFSGNMADLLVTTDALTPAQLTTASTSGVVFGVVSNSSGGILSAGSSVAIANGATLDLNGTSQVIAGLQDSGTAPGGLATSTTAGTGAASLTLLTTTANAFSGNITNGSSVITLKVTGTGSQTLSGTNTYTGGTVVGTGTDSPLLVLSGKASFPTASTLTVNSGTAQIAAHTGGAANVVVLAPSTLTIGGTTGAWTGKVDVTNNDLDLAGASLTTVTNQIASGFAAGAWTGNGITSSTAAADSTHLTAVGVATGLTSFEGATVSATDILVKYTYFGDANLDGAVDGSDYTKIDAGFISGGTLTGWQNGDFNYDGKIDGSDYTLIDNAFNTQGATLGTNPALLVASSTALVGSSAVPEPTTLGLIGIGAAGLLGRRRRK